MIFIKSIKLKIKDKSTLSKGEYLFNHVFFSIAIAYNTYIILPLIVPIAQYNNSIPRLIFCMLLTGFFCILFNFYYNRQNKIIIQDIIIGIGLYTILTIGEYGFGFIKFLINITITISVLEGVFVITKKIKKKKQIKQVLLSRFFRILKIVQRNFFITSLIVIIAMPIGLNFLKNEELDKDYYKKVFEKYGINANGIQDGIEFSKFIEELSVYEAYGEKYKLSENIDTIKLIRDNNIFQSLDYNKKCEVLEAVIYSEANSLGLCKLNVVFTDMEDDSLRGAYNHSTKTITINSKHIKDSNISGGTAEELLTTILHESRHCYQNLIFELFIDLSPEQRNLLAFTLEGIDSWIINMIDYTSDFETKEEYIDYCTQPIEQDARNYAQNKAKVYYSEIDSYLNGVVSDF